MKSSYSNFRRSKVSCMYSDAWAYYRLMFDLKKIIEAKIVEMANYSFYDLLHQTEQYETIFIKIKAILRI